MWGKASRCLELHQLSIEASSWGCSRLHTAKLRLWRASCWKHQFKWKCFHPVDVAGWREAVSEVTRAKTHQETSGVKMGTVSVWSKKSREELVPSPARCPCSLLSHGCWPWSSSVEVNTTSLLERNPCIPAAEFCLWQLLTYTLWCLESNWTSRLQKPL